MEGTNLRKYQMLLYYQPYGNQSCGLSIVSCFHICYGLNSRHRIDDKACLRYKSKRQATLRRPDAKSSILEKHRIYYRFGHRFLNICEPFAIKQKYKNFRRMHLWCDLPANHDVHLFVGNLSAYLYNCPEYSNRHFDEDD